MRHLSRTSKSVTHCRNVVPTGIRGRSPAALLLLVAAMVAIAMACGGESGSRTARGRAIELHASDPVITESVAFSDSLGQHRVLRSRASNRQLAVVEVTVVNRTSIVIPLLVDPEAAQLGDRRGERFNAVDPFASAAIVSSPGLEENRFAPLLWGEVQLERQFQVGGWMVFDVPKGLTLGSLWWNEVEQIVADYVDYFKRG